MPETGLIIALPLILLMAVFIVLFVLTLVFYIGGSERLCLVCGETFKDESLFMEHSKVCKG
jgi:hypothetical protein